MNLVLTLPTYLEAQIKKHAAEAVPTCLRTYIEQTRRSSNLESSGPRSISDEQFAASLEPLRQIHFKANPIFDDTRKQATWPSMCLSQWLRNHLERFHENLDTEAVARTTKVFGQVLLR